MTSGRRLILLATLPIALTFAGCDGKNGLSRVKPDSGAPDSGNPDTALPGNPDTALSGGSDTPLPRNPDTALSGNPDTPLPRNPDTALSGDPDTPLPRNPDTALPGNPDTPLPRDLNADSGPPIRPADAAIVDVVFVGVDAGPSKDVLGADKPTPVGPAIFTVTPSSVDFGAIAVGTISAPVMVTVTNMGGTASGPLNVTVSAAGINAFGCNGITLAPEASCTITISALQTVAGPFSGTVEVGDTLADSKRIAVVGIGTPGTQGMLSLDPASLDLGSVLAGKTATGTIVLTNNAATDASGIIINVSGTGYRAQAGGTCTDELAPGQSCNIVVGFTAGLTYGPAKGTVTVSVKGVTKSVAVTARALAPAKLIMTPASVSLVAAAGTPSPPVTFYVTNAGDVTSTIPAVTIAGDNKDDFSFSTTCTRAMPGGASDACQIVVVYTAKGAAGTSASATLTVAESGSDGSSATAMLTGIVAASSPP